MENLKILIKWIFFYLLGIFLENFISAYLIYLLCIAGFLTGFLLRIFKKYPGKSEPLILDSSSFIIAAVVFGVSKFFHIIDFKIGFFFIFLPHMIYNIIRILLLFI